MVFKYYSRNESQKSLHIGLRLLHVIFFEFVVKLAFCFSKLLNDYFFSKVFSVIKFDSQAHFFGRSVGYFHKKVFTDNGLHFFTLDLQNFHAEMSLECCSPIVQNDETQNVTQRPPPRIVNCILYRPLCHPLPIWNFSNNSNAF